MFPGLPHLTLLMLPVVLQLRLNETPDCRRCSVEVSIGRVFGDTAGPGELPPEIRAVRRDERGRMLIGGYLPLPPLLYDSLGQFLAKAGHPGRGPGELQAPVVASLAGDTAWVVDGVNARVTGYLVTPAPEVATSWRTVGMSGVLSAVRTAAGSVIVNVFGTARHDFGVPLFRLLPTGERQGLSEVPGPLSRQQARLLMRALAPAAAGGFWAGHLDRYRLERFDERGQLVAALERAPPWFPPGDGSVPMVDPDSPPKATLMALVEDHRSRLWVFTAVADRRFRRAVRGADGPRSPGRAAWRIADDDLYFDTVVDVIDPAAGRLLASARIDQAVAFALSGESDGAIAAGIKRLESGHQRLVLLRIRLRGASES